MLPAQGKVKAPGICKPGAFVWVGAERPLGLLR
jgi:hypothetical protein